MPDDAVPPPAPAPGLDPNAAPPPQTPDQLHDAAIAATEAWQGAPEEKKAELKDAALKAVAAAKVAYKAAVPPPAYDGKADFKLPENAVLDQAHVDAFKAVAKQKGWTQEHAQAVLEQQHGAVVAFRERELAAFEAAKTGWKTELAKDPEIGGEHFVLNMERAMRGAKRMGGDALVQELQRTGFGDHPMLVKAFFNVEKLFKDDTFVPGALPPPKKGRAEDRMYDHPSSKAAAGA